MATGQAPLCSLGLGLSHHGPRGFGTPVVLRMASQDETLTWHAVTWFQPFQPTLEPIPSDPGTFHTWPWNF
jgi:hypothetical protein